MTSPNVTLKLPKDLADRLISEAKAKNISPKDLLTLALDGLKQPLSHSEGQLELDLGLEFRPTSSLEPSPKAGDKTLSFQDFARLAGWDDRDAKFMLKDLRKRSLSGRVIQRLLDGSRVWTYRYLTPYTCPGVPNAGVFVLQNANGLPTRLPGL